MRICKQSILRVKVRNPENACYCPDGFRCLKSGVVTSKISSMIDWMPAGAFNMAPCKVKPDLETGAPLALSYPHFYMVCTTHLLSVWFVPDIVHVCVGNCF